MCFLLYKPRNTVNRKTIPILKMYGHGKRWTSACLHLCCKFTLSDSRIPLQIGYTEVPLKKKKIISVKQLVYIKDETGPYHALAS